MTWENQYLDLLAEINDDGEDRKDRTGTGTKAIFGKQLDINLTKGFPLVTTKKMAWKMVVSELLWFIEGSTDERRLAEIHHGTRDESKKTIWTDNANADYWVSKAKFPGDLGNVYGKQWRSWEGVDGKVHDQLAQAIDKIKNNHTDRRILVSAWNVGDLNNMALPPCHIFYQLFVSNDRKLSLQMYQRSNDFALGNPFNIASYALLLMMIAQVTGCTPHRLIMSLGDVHIYNNHIDGVNEQLSRQPFACPSVWINPEVKNIDDFTMEDFLLDNYVCHPAINYKMST